MSLLNKNPNVPATATEEDILKFNGFKTLGGRTFLALVGISIQVFIRPSKRIDGRVSEFEVTIYHPDRPDSHMYFDTLAEAFGHINIYLDRKGIRQKFTIPDWVVLE